MGETMGREPGAGMMRDLEGWEESVAGTFNAQEVANTLCSYATMGREPGAGMMKALEGAGRGVVGRIQHAGRGKHVRQHL